MKLRCLFGHKVVHDHIELICDSCTFMIDHCTRCDSYRTTVLGYGGMSTKPWLSKTAYEAEQKRMREAYEGNR
mgnify:FL=1